MSLDEDQEYVIFLFFFLVVVVVDKFIGAICSVSVHAVEWEPLLASGIFATFLQRMGNFVNLQFLNQGGYPLCYVNAKLARFSGYFFTKIKL